MVGIIFIGKCLMNMLCDKVFFKWGFSVGGSWGFEVLFLVKWYRKFL